MSHHSGSRPPVPGLRNQAGTRTVLRAVGLVLLVGGLAALGYGFVSFASGIFSDDMGLDPAMSGPGDMGRSFALFAGGGFAAVVGFGLTSAGFMGATARYGAGETMPVVKDSAAYLTDGEGLLGVGRTVDDAAPGQAHDAATGPYCSRCGVRNDHDARFCDSCGNAVA